MVNKFTIYGERCSGTNYLESLMVNNFNVSVTWEYGWKHFFGFKSLNDSDDTLFIGIVRNPVDWLNSFYKTPYHLPPQLCPKQLHPKWKNNVQLQAINHNINAYNFLNKEIYSLHYDNNSKENMNDRNMYTKKRYTNIFEMRHTKLKFLMKDMPNKVKHYIFIKYEDLVHKFEETMKRIQEAGQLTIKSDIVLSSSFPKNIYTYKGIKNGKKYSKDTNKPLPPHKILNHPNFIKTFERQLRYVND
jgi:hypothetical protein